METKTNQKNTKDNIKTQRIPKKKKYQNKKSTTTVLADVLFTKIN